jgi:hypothetical protein
MPSKPQCEGGGQEVMTDEGRWIWRDHNVQCPCCGKQLRGRVRRRRCIGSWEYVNKVPAHRKAEGE